MRQMIGTFVSGVRGESTSKAALPGGALLSFFDSR